MTSYNPVIKNGASGAIFYVSLLSQGTDSIFQSNPTLATGDVKLSKDGGALTNLGTLPAVTPASSKLVKVTLSQTETNADNLAILFSDAAGAEWADLMVSIQTASTQFDDLGTLAADITSIKAKTDSLTFSTGSRVDSQVFGMEANTVTATAIATDAITSAELAASAVTEIQAGLATAASIAALNNLSAAEVNAEVVDCLNVDTYAEPAQGAPPATGSIVAKIGYISKSARNKKTQDATTYKLFNDDGTTVDHKATISDDGVTLTVGEVVSGP